MVVGKNMNLFKKKELFQGLYYVNKNDEPTIEITDAVYWLEEITTVGFRYKTRERKAREYFQEKYPELIKFIKLF